MNTKEENNIVIEDESNTITNEEVIEGLNVKLKDYEDRYFRALADLENARRRFEKMQSETTKYAVSDMSKELLSVVDVFNKAFKEIEGKKVDDTASVFVNGIRLTHKELEKILQKFGVNKINALGQKFDANLHESFFSVKDESKDDDTIIEVVEDGYTISDRLLRSAKVGVVKNQ